MRWARLLHMGSPVADSTYRIEQLPPLGGEVVASEASLTPGGGFNMMAAARAAGMEVACGGRVGTGPDGTFLMQALEAVGIALLGRRATHADSGTCVVLVTPDGERSFVSHPGAEGRIEPGDYAAIRVRPDDVVFVSAYTLAYPDAAGALGEWIAVLPREVPLAVDPGPLVPHIVPSVLEPILARADWLSCSAAEATAMTGEAEPAAAAKVLLGERRCTNPVLRDGPRGRILAQAGSSIRRFPPGLQRAGDRYERRWRYPFRRFFGRPRPRRRRGQRCWLCQRRRSDSRVPAQWLCRPLGRRDPRLPRATDQQVR